MAQKQKKTNPLYWAIMLLVLVGLFGFGTNSLTGTATAIGTVGNRDISVALYENQLNQRMRAISQQLGTPVTLQQALALGIDQSVLAQLVTQRVLDNESDQLGMSVGDARVLETVLAIPAFQGLNGKFDRAAYTEALRRIGETESAFEQSIRDDLTRSLLQGAVFGGVATPAAYGEAITTYVGETRKITSASLTAADLTAPVPGATDADIAAHYAENGADFMQPELRDIAYVWLTPAMIQDDLVVDEAAIRALYDDRSAQYQQPERRLVERLAFVDQPAAEAAVARIAAGDVTFDALVAERGLALSDVDLGDVAQDDLGAAGEAVFAARSGDVVGPLNSSLGPALFRVNAVLAAETTSFEEAAPDLRTELANEQARRAIDTASETINDLLAGGASLEDLAERTDLQLGRIAFSTDSTEGIAAYDEFRMAASAAAQGAFPSLLNLSDGGVFAIRLDQVTPPQQRPLADVRDAVAAAWTARTTQAMVMAQAQGLAAEIDAGTAFDTLGLTATETNGLNRRSFVEGAPAEFATALFAMNPGDVQVVDGGDAALIVRLDAIIPADLESDAVKAQMDAISEQVTIGIAQDIFDAYTASVQGRTDVQINQAVVNAINAQMQ